MPSTINIDALSNPSKTQGTVENETTADASSPDKPRSPAQGQIKVFTLYTAILTAEANISHAGVYGLALGAFLHLRFPTRSSLIPFHRPSCSQPRTMRALYAASAVTVALPVSRQLLRRVGPWPCEGPEPRLISTLDIIFCSLGYLTLTRDWPDVSTTPKESAPRWKAWVPRDPRYCAAFFGTAVIGAGVGNVGDWLLLRLFTGLNNSARARRDAQLLGSRELERKETPSCLDVLDVPSQQVALEIELAGAGAVASHRVRWTAGC